MYKTISILIKLGQQHENVIKQNALVQIIILYVDLM